MRENRPSGSEGGARFNPSFLPLSGAVSRCTPPGSALESSLDGTGGLRGDRGFKKATVHDSKFPRGFLCVGRPRGQCGAEPQPLDRTGHGPSKAGSRRGVTLSRASPGKARLAVSALSLRLPVIRNLCGNMCVGEFVLRPDSPFWHAWLRGSGRNRTAPPGER